MLNELLPDDKREIFGASREFLFDSRAWIVLDYEDFKKVLDLYKPPIGYLKINSTVQKKEITSSSYGQIDLDPEELDVIKKSLVSMELPVRSVARTEDGKVVYEISARDMMERLKNKTDKDDDASNNEEAYKIWKRYYLKKSIEREEVVRKWHKEGVAIDYDGSSIDFILFDQETVSYTPFDEKNIKDIGKNVIDIQKYR